MGVHIIRNQKIWLGGHDLTGVLNSAAVEDSVALKEATTLGDSAVRRLAGLRDAKLALEGYFSASPEDEALNANLGLTDVPVTFGAINGTEGNLAYLFAAALADYQPNGTVGEVFAFAATAQSSAGEPLVRGTLMHNATRTSTANGTARQLGAIAAGQKLYAALHVLTVAGTTPELDVKVQSDDASGFASPIDRITFSQKTGIASEWATPVAGAITDDWWRVTWTIGGTSPSFAFVVSIGIQ
jgi:hypothetical protein